MFVIQLNFIHLQILDDEISADFYVAVPDILPKLVPLKNKLRKKFPKSKRGKRGLKYSSHSPRLKLFFISVCNEEEKILYVCDAIPLTIVHLARDGFTAGALATAQDDKMPVKCK